MVAQMSATQQTGGRLGAEKAALSEQLRELREERVAWDAERGRLQQEVHGANSLGKAESERAAVAEKEAAMLNAALTSLRDSGMAGSTCV